MIYAVFIFYFHGRMKKKKARHENVEASYLSPNYETFPLATSVLNIKFEAWHMPIQN